MSALRAVPASRVYLAVAFGFGLAFATMSTLSAVYRAVSADLTPFQLVIVGTVLESSVFLAEVPTGVVADIYSRRLSIIIGFALIGVGFVVESAVPQFATILLAQVIWGVGYTFTSGATEAWITDEVGESNVLPLFFRASQLRRAGTILGIGLSVALGSVALFLPILVAGLLFVAFAAALTVAMPETAFHRTPAEERSSFHQMGDTLTAGLRTVRTRPALGVILAIGVVGGLWSEGFDRLWELHFLRNFDFPALGSLDPVVWFGIIGIAAMLLSILGTEVVRRRFRRGDPAGIIRLLMAFDAALVVSLVAFAMASGFAMAVAAFWAAGLARSLGGPLYVAWLNRGLEPKIRATILSMSSLTDSFGQLTGGPIIGAIASAVSVRAAILVAAAILSPVLLLFGLARRITRRSEDRVRRAEAVSEP